MIGIVDYGMGNLGSVNNACQFLKLPAQIIEKPAQIAECGALILPGVGAFGDCMKHLNEASVAAEVQHRLGWGVGARRGLPTCRPRGKRSNVP